MSDLTRVNIAAGSTDVTAAAPDPYLRLVGVSILETTGSAGVVVSIQDGATTDTSKEVVAISAGAGSANTVWLSDYGVPCPNGIWVDRTGSARVVVFYTTRDRFV